MKRLVALAALLVPLWGCVQPAEAPANAPTTNVNTNANATTMTTTAPTTTTAVSEAAITDQEKKVWDALKGKDMAAFGALLAEDFMYVANDGLHDKQGTLAGLKNFNPTEVTLADWQVVTIDEDAAVVLYTATAKGTADGNPIPATPTRGSSVWINRGGKWVAIYHQDCDVKPAAATPPAAASNTPKAASPANANAPAPPANTAAETADPITKEKQLWEELKHNNLPAFASDLADNAMEIEPDGVYDKAGTLNSIKAVDFSKTSVSDFKQLKIDDDATLVTYIVKNPGQAAERHSTVWAKRGDKWLALFHHGTPVMAAPAHK